MTDDPRRPVLIDLGPDAPHAAPAQAPVVPDAGDAPRGQAMRAAAALAARRSSPLARLFRWAAGGFLGFAVSLAAWDFVTGLLARSPVLGGVAAGLLVVALLALAGIAVREWAAFVRLGRIDGIRRDAESALAAADLQAARAVAARLQALYENRADQAWALARLRDRRDDLFDADGLLALAETTLLAPLDRAAVREIEAAARQVAAVTAFVPLALADVIAALTANLRMIRRIAEIYGGRSGRLGNWRLARTVFTHLVATGAVAVGDDMIGSVAGGGLLSRLSRRFGEGVVNGALTARVGVSALEVCRPLSFRAVSRPGVSGLVSGALAGLFGGRDGGAEGQGAARTRATQAATEAER